MSLTWLIVLLVLALLGGGPDAVPLEFWLLLIPFLVQDNWDRRKL